MVDAACRPGTPQCFMFTPKLLPDLPYSRDVYPMSIFNGIHVNSLTQAFQQVCAKLTTPRVRNPRLGVLSAHPGVLVGARCKDAVVTSLSHAVAAKRGRCVCRRAAGERLPKFSSLLGSPDPSKTQSCCAAQPCSSRTSVPPSVSRLCEDWLVLWLLLTRGFPLQWQPVARLTDHAVERCLLLTACRESRISFNLKQAQIKLERCMWSFCVLLRSLQDLQG